MDEFSKTFSSSDEPLYTTDALSLSVEPLYTTDALATSRPQKKKFIPKRKLNKTILNIVCPQKKLIEPIVLDCKNLRLARQQSNNKKTLEALLHPATTEKQLKDISNDKEFDRTLEDLKLTFEQFMLKCRADHEFAVLAARHISIKASRQGSKDEDFVLTRCNEITKQFGVQIANIPNTAARPTKCGKILFKDEYEKSDFKKNDCLKSFDAEITGKVQGWIFAKITFTNGGHQDNVFEEAHTMGEWFMKYGDPAKLYVLLIDTDLIAQFNELREKYHKNNVLVVNHIDLQKYFIDLN